MRRLTALHQIEFLVAKKFPALRGMMRNSYRLGKSNELRAMEQQAAVYRSKLLELSTDALNHLYTDVYNGISQISKPMSQRSPLHVNAERRNRAADYAYWAKMARWSITEAVALSLEILTDIDARIPHHAIETNQSNMAAFKRLKELATRAVETGVIVCVGKGIAPESYIAWARSNAIDFPTELAKLVHQRGVGERERETAAKPVAPRERDTFLKLIGGMAVGGYGYDPKALRSSIVKEIHDDLARQGIALDLDTVRNKLKEASQFLADAI